MNINKIKEDFNILNKKINGKPYVYLDSACMSLKPILVVNKIIEYYANYPTCGGRSNYKLAKDVTWNVEETRRLVKKFINAKYEEEIIFNRNTTEGINLIAKNFDNVLITDREHNSNLIPWKNKIIVNSKKDFTFDFEAFQSKVKGVKLVSFVWTSNLDGYSLPVKEIIKIAHENDSLVMLDAAQAVPHREVNVNGLDVDFLVFSGHKMLGPTGTGILYGKKDLLNKMKPLILGGGTVYDSTYASYKLEDIPKRFEAGLQDYSGIIGLSEAIRYLGKYLDDLESHEKKLIKYLYDNLDVEHVGVNNYALNSSIFNFNLKNRDSHEVAIMLDQMENICVRSGAHCVHSWFNKHNIKGSVRASVYLYNDLNDVKILIECIDKLKKLG
ncbi:aminotransferase class V-fold PLP-dependent enzyme [Candidatus Woesearchaeota archaeon]|nr:aminotransferase class V-fold PLP-dependent enzyme [Candidatus Woesearchaeota archaeon]